MNSETDTDTETHSAHDRYKGIASRVDRETAEKLNPYIGGTCASLVDTLNRVRDGLDMLGNLSVSNDAAKISLENWNWAFYTMSAALRYEVDALDAAMKSKEAT